MVLRANLESARSSTRKRWRLRASRRVWVAHKRRVQVGDFVGGGGGALATVMLLLFVERMLRLEKAEKRPPKLL